LLAEVRRLKDENRRLRAELERKEHGEEAEALYGNRNQSEPDPVQGCRYSG
jgi:hypothetical protein